MFIIIYSIPQNSTHKFSIEKAKVSANIFFVDKRDNPFLSYAYLDSQRLKDTFFSPPKKKRKKKTHKKRFLIIAAGVLAVLAVIFIFFAKYDLMVISKQSIATFTSGTSLFSKTALDDLKFISKDEGLIRKENSFVYLTIPKEKVALSFELKKPIDLKTNSLWLYLKKSDTPLNIAVVVKDTRFFSNSLNPLIIEVKQNDDSFIKVPIDFKDSNLQNTNLYQIKQVTVYFYPQENEKINWAMVKDLILI